MKQEPYTEDPLVGPRSHERTDGIMNSEPISKDGQPLWMAFVSEDALVIDAHATIEATQALNDFLSQNPGVLPTLQGKSFDECLTVIGQLRLSKAA